MILYLAFQHDPVPIQATPSLPVLGLCPCGFIADGDSFRSCSGVVDGQVESGGCLARCCSLHCESWWVGTEIPGSRPGGPLRGAALRRGITPRSLSNLQRQDFGFVTTNRFIAPLDPQMAGYTPGQLEALYRQLHTNLAQIPGMKQVSFSLYSPMEGDNWGEGVFIEGEPPPAVGTRDHGASWLRVAPHYFDAIGTKIVEGRANERAGHAGPHATSPL